MSAKILDGNIISQPILQEVSNQIIARKKQGFRAPSLAVILVGDDPASTIYVNNKRSACEKVGITSKIFHYKNNIKQQELLDLINKLNLDPNIDGILIQLPLPNSISSQIILGSVNPNKDVDGFHPNNMGCLVQGWPILQPCTSLGIMKLLDFTGVQLSGKKATVVGCSNIVGKPIASALLNANCTITICNKQTNDLRSFVNAADILVSATGQPHLIKGDWIKKNSIVIDVGTTKVNNKLVGDVEFNVAKKHAGWITKVPGGVGPMTIACLLENTLLTQMLNMQN